MDVPEPPRQRVQITTGDTPSPKIQLKVGFGALLFVSSQLDLVFPSNDALKAALSALETSYVKAPMELARVVEQAATFIHPTELQSTVTMLSVDPHDDVWCLDPRGLLTLHLAKESYQTLGLTGKKLPFKGHTEHTIALALHPAADSAANRSKRNAALKAWDRRRAAGWTVLYCAKDPGETARFAAENGHANLVRNVSCQATSSVAMRVPQVTLPARPADADAAEDWEVDMEGLFEWVGMACLGAQRLQANDRVDAYVAVYEPPEPSMVGEITHLRWRGFLGPDFVQSVIDVACTTPSEFVSITSHAFPTSPVSYIPIRDPPSLSSPARASRIDGEDTWSLLVASKRWCLAESIGPLDTRWG
ncbi:ribonuclease P 40kDa subunit-domain-containing protein [Mycena rebaudengoi]|nr:ribonuclease P 40kDa subunit-domain-containing protein [Mycena rebaudengoi]